MVLLNIASAAWLFHTSDSVAFADLTIDSHHGPQQALRCSVRRRYYKLKATE
jgi:hypothetical protein